jgi:trehalose 6-phosphate phosphatase
MMMSGSDPQSLPSALLHLDKIEEQTEHKKLAVFLDYDGTLTPIVKRPEEALLAEDMRAALQRLASICLLAVISGRDRADVEQLVGLDELIYAGSHGFDIAGPGAMELQYEGGKERMPELDKAEAQLRAQIEPIPGAQVERKRYAIAVHYRNVAGEEVDHIKRLVADISRQHAGLKTSGGKMIVELRPDIDWDKGKAVWWLLHKLNADRPKVLPLYIGDDITDEDAFRALIDQGIGILVGEHGEPTFAKFRLADVEEVRQFLHQLTGILKSRLVFS